MASSTSGSPRATAASTRSSSRTSGRSPRSSRSPRRGTRTTRIEGGALEARAVEIADDERRDEAVDPEEMPAARLQPAAQPFEREEPGEEGEDHPQDARRDRGDHPGEMMVLRLIEPPDLARVRGRCEHHGEREAEILGRAARNAGEETRGDGGTGAREAAEGNAETLDGADPGVLRGRQLVRVVSLPAAAILVQACREDEDAGGAERDGYQVEAPEELLDPRVRLAAHRHFLDELDDDASHDAGQDRGGYHRDGEVPEPGCGVEERAAPSLPEIDDH